MHRIPRLTRTASLVAAVMIGFTTIASTVGLWQAVKVHQRTERTMKRRYAETLDQMARQAVEDIVIAAEERHEAVLRMAEQKAKMMLSVEYAMVAHLYQSYADELPAAVLKQQTLDVLSELTDESGMRVSLVFNERDGHVLLPAGREFESDRIACAYSRETGPAYSGPVTTHATITNTAADGSEPVPTQVVTAMREFKPYGWIVCANVTTAAANDRQKRLLMRTVHDLQIRRGIRLHVFAPTWSVIPSRSGLSSLQPGASAGFNLEEYSHMRDQKEIVRAIALAARMRSNSVVEIPPEKNTSTEVRHVVFVASLPQWGWIVVADTDPNVVARRFASIRRITDDYFGLPLHLALLVVLFAVILVTLIVGASALVIGPFRQFEGLLMQSAASRTPIDTRRLRYEELMRPAERINGIAEQLRALSENLRTTERKFLQAQKMEAVGRLSSGIAHDFNNILTVIIGYSELSLVNSNDADMDERPMRQIHNSALQAAKLTNQLLSYTRRQDSSSARMNTNRALGELEKMLRPIIREDIALEIAAEKHLGSIDTAESQFKQAILNLVVNGCDAMPDGGKLSIRAVRIPEGVVNTGSRSATKPHCYVAIEIRDTGTGMDEETKAHALEPFFTTKGAGRGTGLGLSTVYETVTKGGGTMEISSLIGQGTMVRLVFPSSMGGGQETAGLPNADIVLGNRETILVAEDQAAVRTVLVSMLKRSGYRVIEADGGMSALEVLRDGEIDLVISDVIMPDMTGDQLLERLPSKHRGLPFLFITGYQEYRDLRGYPVLQKPLSPSSLTNKVREMLNSRVERTESRKDIPCSK